QKTLVNFTNNTRKEISIDYVQRLVSDYFKILFDQIESKTRKRYVVQACQLAMYFAKKYTKASLSSIRSQIGNRDHATVLHACKTVKNFSETDKVFRGYVEDINRKIIVE